jgi:hypothetical protein
VHFIEEIGGKKRPLILFLKAGRNANFSREKQKKKKNADTSMWKVRCSWSCY